ncbi:MAG: Endonuclease MutS2 [bacterium]|nr:Endonuclease MutS2 [bacterium]
MSTPDTMPVPTTTVPDPPQFALGALEFDKIRQRLAGFAESSLGAGHCRALVPSVILEEIEGWLDETEQAEMFLWREEQRLSVAGLRDMRQPALVASKGGVLGMHPLYHLGRTCQITNQLKNALEQCKGRYPALQPYGQALSFTNLVANRCEATFENEETIRDTATPALKSIRRGIQEQQGHIHDKAQRLAQKLYQGGLLSTPSFTIRNGRYVLPFQSGAMGRIPVIIQGTSESGATIWAEPNELVEANNKLAQLRLEEEQEIERILIELSELVGQHGEAIVTNITIAAEIDLILARAKLARDLRATRPRVGATGGESGTEIRLLEARHPLIAKDRVIASDICFGDQQRGLIITGPNAGGKTVALKVLGLSACMAQSGLFIPAKEGSALPLFGAVMAEIGDQQSLELDLSSFSAHVTYLKRCLHYVQELKSGSLKPLILLDEIGRATDPQEGSALALALTEVFLKAGAFFAITTHLPALKNLVIGGHPNIIGGAVEFDVEKLEPRFRLVIPAVGASYAIIVTEKMGLNQEVVDRAKGLVGRQFRLLELEIPALERKRQELEAQVEQAELRWDAFARREQHQATLLLAMQQYTLHLLTEALDATAEMLKDARRKVARLAQQSRAAEAVIQTQAEAEAEVRKLGSLKHQLEEQQRGLRRASNRPEAALLTSPESPSAGEAPLVVGSRVWIPLLKREGEILKFRKQGAVAEIGLDGKRLTVDTSDLRLAKGEAPASRPANRPAPKTEFYVERPVNVPLWLDLHGERVLEGLEKLEDFLQGAYLQQRETATVLHGIGTLKLRSAIWEVLRKHPLVAGFREGEPTEGGAGVTIVTFRK